jgi:hypothetical protein
MYSTRSGLVLGFHGCDESIAQDVLSGKAFLKKSVNDYDWLGNGIYFWENSPSRALEFVTSLQKYPAKSKGAVKNPAVIGAVIDLGYCLDLQDYQNRQSLKNAYDFMSNSISPSQMPQNRRVGNTGEFLIRRLDCAVIVAVHFFQQQSGQLPFDSVRGIFIEGEELYPNAGFHEKDHIQICIINPNCIKGLFLPRELDLSFAKV